jgi:hypothetical protein
VPLPSTPWLRFSPFYSVLFATYRPEKWWQCGNNRAQDTAEPVRMHVETKAAFWLI